MKNIILIFTIFLSSTFTRAQTNIYHAFPDSNAYWSETSWFVTFPSFCHVINIQTIYIFGDTILGTNTYHKIFKYGYISSTNCPSQGNYYTKYYLGALRQDTIQKKVYYYPSTSSNEELLYDFNLTIGDTLPISFNMGQQDTVYSIDSVLIGNSYRKRFILKSINNTFPPPDTSYAIIEGVGSTFGLLSTMDISSESGSVLICFADNGQYYPANSNCLLSVNVSEINNQPINVTIVPNPFYVETILQTDKSLSKATLAIYNSLGQKVKQLENMNGQTNILRRENLVSGLYYYQILVDNNILKTDKFLILDE